MTLLKNLKRFHEMKLNRRSLMAIVLIGQPELMDKIGINAGKEVREVSNRLVTCEIFPLDMQLEAYVAHKLSRAHARPIDELFEKDTWDAIRACLIGTVNRGTKSEVASMTYPLRVNNLLVLLLNSAAKIGVPKVNAAIVRDLFKRGGKV